ncbi:HupE/UreJ family protein [Flavobacteriaceae bacterium Ap0902]|nr:HupE/UreJ family protein [Flavobacteriaceae bacterium Ap0902]
MNDFLFYLEIGWSHIISIDALDHILFVLALVVIYKTQDWKRILILVTAFTIGHSITLALSVLDVMRLPGNWIEFLIPLTIALTAADNILLRNQGKSLIKINYYLALIFGFIHGMGFANLARMTMAEEQNILIPLLGFNIGLELGQIIVVIFLLIVSYILINLLKVSRKDWVLMISSGVLALAIQMCLERIPWA